MNDSNRESNLLDDLKCSYVLIAIDTHQSMFIKDDNGDTPFSIALNACYAVADSLLLQNRSYCQFAIAFAEEASRTIFLDFKSNMIDSMKILKTITKLSQDELKDTYMRKATFDLASFLLLCKNKLISTSSRFYDRTIIYLTSDCDPVCVNPQKKIAAINEAKTFNANSITFHLIAMKPNFDYNVFYKRFFFGIKDDLVEEIAEDKNSLFQRLSCKIVTRFAQQRINLYPTKNDKTRYIPIVKKDLFKPNKLLNNARVSSDGRRLKKCIKGDNNPSTKFFLKTHADIVFNLEDQVELRKSDFRVGLTLLYVSKRLTELGLIVLRSEIIEFNESSKENADVCRNIFSKFWQYCYDRERVLVCACKLSSDDHIRFVELVPKYAFNRKLFLMIYIPYQSERMFLPPEEEEEGVTAPKGKRKKVIKALVDTLEFDYNSKSFPNPCFVKKQAYIKSKLLDEPMEDINNATPNMDDMDKRLKDVVSDFKKSFNLETDSNPKKRKMPAGGSRSKKK